MDAREAGDSHPMTDLSAKFAALEQILISQHASMMVVLTAISSKLDALRGDGPENTLKSINESIWNLAGPAPGKSLVDVWNKLDGIFAGLGFGASPIPSYSYHQWLLSNLDKGAGLSLYNLVDGVYDNTTAIATCSCRTAALLGGTVTPDPTDPSGCASPFISSGMTTGDGVTIATWYNSDLSGITLANGHTLYLTVPGPFDGWKAFVSTTAPSVAFDTTTNRYPTNRWVSLDGLSTLKFSVDGQGSLTVYLCGIAYQEGSVVNSSTNAQYGNQELSIETGVPIGTTITISPNGGTFPGVQVSNLDGGGHLKDYFGRTGYDYIWVTTQNYPSGLYFSEHDTGIIPFTITLQAP